MSVLRYKSTINGAEGVGGGVARVVGINLLGKRVNLNVEGYYL